MASAVRRYTVADVRAIPDDRNRYEVIGGRLLVTPAPGTRHQRVLADLFLLVANYVAHHRLGQAWFAPLDVVFGPMTMVEPDLLFVHRDRAHIVTERELTGPPDLVVEVVSPSSAQTDRGRKRALYQNEGVTEYWVVDPANGQVEVWHPGAPAAQICTETLRWHPDSSVDPLVIELGILFG